LGVRGDGSSGAGVGEREFDVRFRERISSPLRPLDQADSVPLEIVGQAGVRKLSCFEESIKIKVVQV
jgi:hypothetical protein